MSRKVDHLYIQVAVLDLIKNAVLSTEPLRPMAILFTYEGFVMKPFDLPKAVGT
jgi:hypothetical protein